MIIFSGFALKKRKPAVVYVQEVVDFVESIYEEGERTKQKCHPPEVVKRIRLHFPVNLWLREANVQYLYNKFGLMKKNNGSLPSTKRMTAEEHLEQEQESQNVADTAAITVMLQQKSVVVESLEDQDHELIVSSSAK